MSNKNPLKTSKATCSNLIHFCNSSTKVPPSRQKNSNSNKSSSKNTSATFNPWKTITWVWCSRVVMTRVVASTITTSCSSSTTITTHKTIPMQMVPTKIISKTMATFSNIPHNPTMNTEKSRSPLPTVPLRCFTIRKRTSRSSSSRRPWKIPITTFLATETTPVSTLKETTLIITAHWTKILSKVVSVNSFKRLQPLAAVIWIKTTWSIKKCFWTQPISPIPTTSHFSCPLATTLTQLPPMYVTKNVSSPHSLIKHTITKLTVCRP